MGEIPLAAADRVIRNATGLRVGHDAANALAEVLEKDGEAISREAGKYAKHAGRKTVKASDIKLATE
ncbi:MAG: NFYB/HAP3 family transcription factor subunit [Candidatus Hydrothermarchaeota archaeon]|jgi:histone H3/H4|nr:NFYB/HAP3 family transcription factor subunit [Candidatus Hydrothermarchaeota archaeon]